MTLRHIHKIIQLILQERHKAAIELNDKERETYYKVLLKDIQTRKTWPPTRELTDLFARVCNELWYTQDYEKNFQLTFGISLDQSPWNKPANPNNQCDGCKRLLPIINGIHRTIDDKPYMACTANKYKEKT